MPDNLTIAHRALPRQRAAPATPRSIRRTGAAVAVIAGIHLLALLLIIAHHDVLRASVAADHPDLTLARIDGLARSQLLQSALPHILVPALLLWLAHRLATARPQVRTRLTIVLVIQVLAHATLPLVLHRLPGYGMSIIAVQTCSLMFEITALTLLWRPQSRAWFEGSA